MAKTIVAESKWRACAMPPHNPGSWSVLNGRIRDFVSRQDVRAALRSWHPNGGTLVAGPDDRCFRTPIEIESLQGDLRSSSARQAWIGIVLIAAVCAVMAGFALQRPTKITLGFPFVLAIVAVTRWYDSFVSLRSTGAIIERGRFFYWARTSRRLRHAFILCALFIASIGIMQALLQSRGSLESAVELVGAPFHALRQGEFWRLATGPLLHNGLSHFISNAVFFLLAAPLALVLFRGWAVAALFLANAAGALVQMAVGSPVFDAYLGISPGVFCLMLFVAVAGRMDKVLLPRGMAEMTAAIAVISIVAAEMLSTNAATAAHLTGAAFGIAFGLAWVHVASGWR